MAILLALLAFTPLGFAACGGGDEAAAPAPTDEPAPTVLTQAEIISAGDGICAEVNAAVGTIQSAETSDPTVAAAQVADLYSGLADRLDSLGVPSDGDAPTEVISAARTLADQATTDTTTALEQFQTAAAAYGFTDCAEDPSAPVATGGDTDTGAGTDTGGTVEPAQAPEPAPAPEPVDPSTGGGGGAAPAPPDTGGGSGGSSGGISPG